MSPSLLIGNWTSHNPFSSARVEPGAIPYLSDGENAAETVLDRAFADGAVQIVGPHGCGKSTLLANVMELATERAIPTVIARGSVSTIPSRGLILLDEADSPAGTATSWHRWRLFLWQCRKWSSSVVVSTHVDLGLPTAWQPLPDTNALHRVVHYLVDGWNIQPPDDALFAFLLRRREGNIRLVLFDLYDWYESLHGDDAVHGDKENSRL